MFKVEEAGHGDILSDEFINWRIKLALNRKQRETTEVEAPQVVAAVPAEAPK